MKWSERDQQIADARENAVILDAFPGALYRPSLPPSHETVSGPTAAPVFGDSDTLTSEYAGWATGLASPKATRCISGSRRRPLLFPKIVVLAVAESLIVLLLVLAGLRGWW